MFEFRSKDNLIVGYDLCDDYTQISYLRADSNNVETLSTIAGEENFNIPTVLCKKEGEESLWFFGKEALRCAEEEQGILIQNLLSMALDGEPVRIEEEIYNPITLLTLFVKKSIGLLEKIGCSIDKIVAIMITCEKMDRYLAQMLSQVITEVCPNTNYIFFQNHVESFYYYMIHQSEDLWRFQTFLFEYKGNDKILIYRMEQNKRTIPIIVFIDSEEYYFPAYAPMPQEKTARIQKMKSFDKEFLPLAESLLQNQMVSSVYLIGEYYHEDWMENSLKYLCRGRRVFQGNNLYSKGACFSLMERMKQSEAGKSHVFLGEDKLNLNIGIAVFRRNQTVYYPILDAGTSWFESQHELECYLQGDKKIEFLMTSLTGNNNRVEGVFLKDLPDGISRLRIHLFLESVNRLIVEVEDLGFGEIRPATHRIWKEEIQL